MHAVPSESPPRRDAHVIQLRRQINGRFGTPPFHAAPRRFRSSTREFFRKRMSGSFFLDVRAHLCIRRSSHLLGYAKARIFGSDVPSSARNLSCRSRQGGVPMTSAFDLKVPREECNPRFLLLNEHVAHRGTRRLIDELLARFHDKDGEFVKRFQTTEFEARLWELYLFACLMEAGIPLDSTHNRPDFASAKSGIPFFIEAVTTNPPPGGNSPSPIAEMPDDLRSGGVLPPLELDGLAAGPRRPGQETQCRSELVATPVQRR